MTSQQPYQLVGLDAQLKITRVFTAKARIANFDGQFSSSLWQFILVRLATLLEVLLKMGPSSGSASGLKKIFWLPKKILDKKKIRLKKKILDQKKISSGKKKISGFKKKISVKKKIFWIEIKNFWLQKKKFWIKKNSG